MNRILFRVDSRKASGFGHIKRSLCIAKELSLFGYAITFVFDQPVDMYITLEISSFGEVIILNCVDKDAVELLSVLQSKSFELCVVDHYALDSIWHKTIRSFFKCSVICIDDLANKRFDVDFLVDQFEEDRYSKKYHGLVNDSAKKLFGSKYAIVPNRNRNNIIYKSNRKKSVGIFLGASPDPTMLKKVINSCKSIPGVNFKLELILVKGKGLENKIRLFCRRFDGVTVTTGQNDLNKFYKKHSVYVGAGGVASLERCYLGLPSVTLVVTENQNSSSNLIRNSNAAIVIDELDDRLVRFKYSLSKMLRNPLLRKTLQRNGKKLIDGNGSARLACKFLEDKILVVPAKPENARDIYNIRNHILVRNNSHDKNPIKYDDHVLWYNSAIVNDEQILLIAKIKKNIIGVIRFDLLQFRQYKVSISVNPKYHGIGIGSLILKKAEDFLLRNHVEECRLVADVLRLNYASHSLFLNLGYIFNGESYEKYI